MVEQASRLLKPARGRFYRGLSGQALVTNWLLKNGIVTGFWRYRHPAKVSYHWESPNLIQRISLDSD